MYGRFALSGDWHWRGKDVVSASAQLAQALSFIKHKADYLVVPGDVFDRPNVGDRHGSTGLLVESLRGVLSAPDLPKTIMIPGNHDKANEFQPPAFAALDPLVEVLDQPGWYERGGVHIAALPWIWGGDAEAILADLAAKAPTDGKPRLLAGHVQVVGAKMSGTFLCEHGSFAVSVATLKAFPADRIALGDFHERQDLTDGRGTYTGALRQLSHGEEGNPAGIELWDPNTGEVEWFECDAAPKYHTVVWKEGEERPELPDGEVRLQTPDWAPPPEEYADINIKPQRVITQQSRQSRLAKDMKNVNLRDDKTLLNVWAKAQDPLPENLEKLESRLSKLLASE